MNFADFPAGAARIQPLQPTREQLEHLALDLARVERSLHELADPFARKQDALADIRKLLLRILWPRERLETAARKSQQCRHAAT